MRIHEIVRESEKSCKDMRNLENMRNYEKVRNCAEIKKMTNCEKSKIQEEILLERGQNLEIFGGQNCELAWPLQEVLVLQ